MIRWLVRPLTESTKLRWLGIRARRFVVMATAIHIPSVRIARPPLPHWRNVVGERVLTENDIEVIRERFHGWEKASASTLAAVFGVSVQRITAIVRRTPTNERNM